jgi:hypothetical protein
MQLNPEDVWTGECNQKIFSPIGITSHGACLSQFPLWDFFECNQMSMPGLKDNPKMTLNSLCGISVNATDAVSAVFRGIGGENQRVIPLTPLLQQAL